MKTVAYNKLNTAFITQKLPKMLKYKSDNIVVLNTCANVFFFVRFKIKNYINHKNLPYFSRGNCWCNLKY